MKRIDYFTRAAELYGSGKISGEVYDAMILNADEFCEDENDDFSDFLPDTYAEVEYSDFESPEAILGARWDDMNYMHYRER